MVNGAILRTFEVLDKRLARCRAVSGEFIDKRCPKCNCSLLSDGVFVWCSFIGGGTERACDYGIATRVASDSLEFVKSDYLNTDDVCVRIGPQVHVSGPIFAAVEKMNPEEKAALLASLTLLDVSDFAIGGPVPPGSL